MKLEFVEIWSKHKMQYKNQHIYIYLQYQYTESQAVEIKNHSTQ